METSEELLSRIDSPDDLKRLDRGQLGALASELRAHLAQSLAKGGGHLAPSLGVVELTLALHYVFSVPEDKIVWDVGHQGYIHKVLTGRRDLLHTIRQLGGLSGFLRIEESPYDIYGAGHASTSISAALGFAKARDLRGSSEKVLAVIGDGALTGGLALEGLNNVAVSGTDIAIVLNDNGMSIAENVGAVAAYLDKLRGGAGVKGAKVLLEELGVTYMGPVDGHDIPLLLETFRRVRETKGPVLVHVLTAKGRGLSYAEADSRTYHGVGPFSPEDGKIESKGGETFTDAFAQTLIEAAAENKRLVAITAAMPDGTGLDKFAEAYPERCFDVGIAEQHGVTFACGLAAAGYHPVCAIYSTFLQRAYDQIIHDACLQRLPVKFFLDRAGLVGADGGTHHGVFDIPYLRCIPNMVVLAPRDVEELKEMTRFALSYREGPIAVRYPRGGGANKVGTMAPVELGRAEVLREGGDVTLIGFGVGTPIALEAADLLKERGVEAGVINARFAKPLDERAILEAARRTGHIVTVEDGVRDGGFGSAVLELLADRGVSCRVERIGLPDHFVEHGPVPALREAAGLTAAKVAEAAT